MNILCEDKYLKRAAVWISLSPLWFHVIWLFNYLVTNGGDAAGKLWFYYFMVLSIFAYPGYNLFRWRKDCCHHLKDENSELYAPAN